MRQLVLAALVLASCDSGTTIFGTTQLKDTQDRLGPYVVLTEATDPDGIEKVTLSYRVGDSAEIEVEMTAISQGVFEGSIPGQPPFTNIEYFVVAKDGEELVSDPAGALDSATQRYRFKVLSSKCTVDLECGPGEFCDASSRCRQHLGPCTTDKECGNSMRCWEDGSCRLAARSCQLDEDCLPGEVCDAILAECVPRPRCDQGLSCPLDFTCDTLLEICKRSCAGSVDCGPGEDCRSGICSGAKPCVNKGDCDKGLICDAIGNYCRPEGAALCATCVRDADCGGPTDFCLLLSAGQFCGQDCSATSCPAGYSCNKNTVPGQCVPDSGICP